MKIIIETIPSKSQRYPTCGDYFYDTDGVLHIKVSKLSEKKRELLIAIHELVEVALCEEAGITNDMIDKFDKEFEAHRHPDNFDEPGDDPSAPYMKQHCIATGIERLLAAELGVSWKEYEEEINAL